MLDLGIDQHARQVTISLRAEDSDVLQARQVSTQPERNHALFQQLTRERLRDGESFGAVLEVCGPVAALSRLLHNRLAQVLPRTVPRQPNLAIPLPRFERVKQNGRCLLDLAERPISGCLRLCAVGFFRILQWGR